MSSFYRSAAEISTSQEDSSAGADADKDDDDDVEAKVIDSVVETNPTTLSTPRDSSTAALIHGSDRNHSHYLLHALLEERCVNEVIAHFRQRIGDSDGLLFTKDHPEVKALAELKYCHLSEQLSRNGLVPAGPEGEDSRQLREAYRQGLDLLSSGGPLPDRSRFALDAAISRLSISTPRTAPEMLVSQVATLPDVLQPFIDHPMFELSRYLRDFTEIGLVGKGGYGKVYHVKHRLDGSEYAVKKIILSSGRISKIRMHGETELDALLSEVRTLARFDHPNIVRYYAGWLEYTFPSRLPLDSSSRLSPRLLEQPSSESDEDASVITREFTDPHNIRTLPDEGTSNFNIVFEHSTDQEGTNSKRVSSPGSVSRSHAHFATGSNSIGTLENTTSEDVDEALLVNQLSSSRLEAFSNSAPREFGASSSHHTTGTSPQFVSPPPQLTLHIQMAMHSQSLADYLSPTDQQKPRHCFHPQVSLRILLAVLDGVQYLHSCKVVHRDLKPSNVLLSFDCSPSPSSVDLSQCNDCRNGKASHVQPGHLGLRIGDFGLVTSLAQPETQYQSIATSTKSVGTELYRPPISSTANEKIDVYALGVIATELLFPFNTRMERQEILQKLRKEQLADDGFDHVGPLGKDIADLIRQMACSDEQNRLTCAQVRKRVLALLD